MRTPSRPWVCALPVAAAAVLLPLCASRVAADTLWVQASQAVQLRGPVALGGRMGLAEEGAMGDFLVSTVCVAADKLTGGYAEYRIEIPKTAVYYVWARLRYPTGPEGSFALIPEFEEPTAGASRMLGGSGVGVRRWHWDSQGRGPQSRPGEGRLQLQFQRGPLALRIYARQARDTVFQPADWRMARPMFNPRLNILCLTTDPLYVPTDADAQNALGLTPSSVDPGALKVAQTKLPPVSRQELAARGKKPIPDWLRCPRFYTKDCWRSELEFRKPGDIAFMVRQIAACEGSAFRMAAYFGGDAYFQSKAAPHAPGLGSLDYLREAIDEGDRLGVKIVMYMNPNTLYEDHPLHEECVVREADGRAWTRPGYGIRGSHFVCINNPQYRRLLEAVLEEAFTGYRPAGLYVDGLTPHRCFCRYCQEKYRKMFGRAMPVEKLAAGDRWTVLWEMVSRPEPAGDPSDPETARYTQFLCASLADATRLVSETVKRRRPEAVTMFHSWPKPETLDYYDGTLTEIYVRNPWRHALWKFGELANYSNIFPTPVLFNIYLHDHGTEAEARTKMFQGLANGCFPNCWNSLSMKPVFRFLRENAECFDFLRTSPVRFLAFPRGIHANSAQARVMADRSSPAPPVRDRFLAPYVGFYSALVRQGLPIVTMQQSDFHQRLDGFRVLCLANEACLSDEQIGAIRRFVKAGGGLVATHETSLYDEKGNRRGDFGLADVFGGHYVRTAPAATRPVRFEADHPVTAGLKALEAPMHDEPHVIMRLVGAEPLAVLAGEDPPRPSPPAVVVRQYGKGRVVYAPGRLDAIQCDRLTPATERLFANAVRWVVGGQTPVEVASSAPVAVTLFDQPERRIVHLVSLNGDTRYASDEIAPIGNVRLQLRAPKGRQVTKVRRLWKAGDAPFQIDADKISVALEQVGEYEVLVAEWGAK